ncbi:hypothetical protein TgHK011_010129 [Trichoderma gracile]|nr:hypothetical protein TgHK011_010129 [Trichoderma gracile]
MLLHDSISIAIRRVEDARPARYGSQGSVSQPVERRWPFPSDGCATNGRYTQGVRANAGQIVKPSGSEAPPCRRLAGRRLGELAASLCCYGGRRAGARTTSKGSLALTSAGRRLTRLDSGGDKTYGGIVDSGIVKAGMILQDAPSVIPFPLSGLCSSSPRPLEISRILSRDYGSRGEATMEVDDLLDHGQIIPHTANLIGVAETNHRRAYGLVVGSSSSPNCHIYNGVRAPMREQIHEDEPTSRQQMDGECIQGSGHVCAAWPCRAHKWHTCGLSSVFGCWLYDHVMGGGWRETGAAEVRTMEYGDGRSCRVLWLGEMSSSVTTPDRS